MSVVSSISRKLCCAKQSRRGVSLSASWEVVADAVSLRPEFSFLVVVEDPSVKQIEYQTDSGSAHDG